MSFEKAPLVSIVIPSYNYGQYLGRALQSVLEQTYTNWEAIVVDNHSTDETNAVMDKFSESRIRHLKINNNGIIAASRNLGLRSSNGSYIAFLDADDWWSNNKLSVCVSILDRGADVVYHELEVIGGNKLLGRKRLIGSWQVRPPVQIDLLLRGNALAMSSVIVRRACLDKLSGFDENPAMVACEDYNLWLQLAGVTQKFVYCRGVMGFYADHGGGVSNKDLSLAARSATERFRNRLKYSQIKYLEAKIEYLRLRHLYRTGNYSAVRGQCGKSLFDGPLLNRAKSLYMYLIASTKSNV